MATTRRDIEIGLCDMHHPSLPGDGQAKQRRIKTSIAELEAVLAQTADERTRGVLALAIQQRSALLAIAELEAVLAQTEDEWTRGVLALAIQRRRDLLLELSGGQPPHSAQAADVRGRGQ